VSFKSDDLKSIEEEIKKIKFYKSTSDKNNNKININNLNINSFINSNSKIRHSSIMKLNSSVEDGRNDNIIKKLSRAQSSSFKFFQANNTLKKEGVSFTNQQNRQININIVNKSSKKK
jgi:hypothetical protein